MIVKLEGIVNEEMVDQLIEAHNACPPEEELHVYLGTDGGAEDDMNTIINIINESEKISVVFCTSRVFSAGFVIAMTCMKPVEFVEGCLGMFHKGTFYGGMWTDELKVHKQVKDVMKLHSKKAKQLTEEMISLGIFTPKEEEKLRKGKDVYCSTERLREMRQIVWQPIQDEIEAYIKEQQAQEEEAFKLREEAKNKEFRKEIEDIEKKVAEVCGEVVEKPKTVKNTK